jgi:histidinol-phosphatase (PHP family)
MYDSHVHSEYSRDSSMTLETLAVTALKRGIHTIALTDHIDFDLGDDEWFEYDKRLAQIKKINARYHELTITNSVEIGLDLQAVDRMKDYLKSHPFEHRILSVHAIDGEELFEQRIFMNHEPMSVLKRYIEILSEGINLLDEFDVVGHLDYLRRYSPEIEAIPSEQAAVLYDSILINLIKRDKGLEINTSAQYYGNEWFYPHPEILKRYKALGGRLVTIGSDSHVPQTLGNGFKEATQWVNDLGLIRKV